MLDEAAIREQIAAAVDAVRAQNPMAGSVTNNVTIDFVANAQLAVGGSAAMVYLPDEAEGLALAGGALYMNMGTLVPLLEETMPHAAKVLHEAGKPWVLDPVGLGIGSLRTKILSDLKPFKPTVVRGNASEIIGLAGLWGLDGDAAEIAAKRDLMAKIDSFAEANPMLGLRGCRLGIVMPGLSAMQVRAIATATAKLIKEGFDPKPEVMIPLVSMENELIYVREEAEKAIKEVEERDGVDLSFIEIGTMIELPRAAVTADEIAEKADFFSFGTNDLTQTTFGFSRDDVEGKFFKDYSELGIMKVNPFATVDDGVVKLIDIAVKGGRSTNPELVTGVCGEHGGDPDSIAKFHKVGLNYVSCSPYSVPVARLAAAHAALAK